MAKLRERISYRISTDGLIRFLHRSVSHLISTPSILVEPVYQVLKPSWTTLTLETGECQFTLDPAMISSRDFREAFESETAVISDLVDNIHSDDIFWDVGANVGVFTCFAAKEIADGADIVAFEPHPGIRSYLETNIERNTPESRIIPYGLSDETETQELSEIGMAAHTVAETDDHDTIDIELLTAETAVERHAIPRPTVVKLDIEGAELAALHGFGPILDDVRLLYCEVHPKRLTQLGASPDAVEAFLVDAGFTVEQLGERENTFFLRCTRPQ